MAKQPYIIADVPTNIITGFLGVGKTSAILHLLKTKPVDERWAVLVNEFGEIGVDGSLFKGQNKESQGIFIREVPGGCMCCTAGLPMQIALNQLLKKAKPSRLLIEPTGLGHPKEVLEVLLAEPYQEILDVQSIMTLVDARTLTDKRYTEHDTFNQQIAIADIVIGNKIDLYSDKEQIQLIDYVKQRGSSQAQIFFTQNGQVPLNFLSGKTAFTLEACHQHSTVTQPSPLSDAPIPNCGYLKATNEGEGFKSVGWRLSPSLTFNYEKLLAFLMGVRAERMKAVFITGNGVFGYNLTSDALNEVKLDDCLESRIEIIAHRIDDSWEPQLLACLA